MESNIKEWVGIVFLNLLFGIAIRFFMGGMTNIPIEDMNYITVRTLLAWIMYGMTSYLIFKVIVMGNSVKEFVFSSLIFGIMTAIFKTFCDYIRRQCFPIIGNFVKIAIRDEIFTEIFVLCLMSLIILKIGKKRVRPVWRLIKKPVISLLIVHIFYAILAGNYIWQKYAAIAAYDAAEEEIINLDRHFAYKILDWNAWFCTVILILLWWFMRRLTADKKGE